MYLLFFRPLMPTSLFLLLITAHKDAHPLLWLYCPEPGVSWPRPKTENTAVLFMQVANTE